MDARDRLELVAHLAPASANTVGTGVRDGKRDARHQEMIGVESGIDAQRSGKAADHQARSNQQNKGERDFNDHENALSAKAGATRARSSFSQRGVLVEARRFQRRHQPEEHSGDVDATIVTDEHTPVNPVSPQLEAAGHPAARRAQPRFPRRQ